MLKLTMLTLVITLAASSLDSKWQVYKKTYNKIYTEDEDDARRNIWQTNLQKIGQHNKLYAQGQSSYYMGENQFTDMTAEEFRNKMTGLTVPNHFNPGNHHQPSLPRLHKHDLPDQVDWRTKGYVTPVKDQGHCGSCWAFSAIGAVEGAHFKAAGKLVSLSESQVVDSSLPWGNTGCFGGYPSIAFEYIINSTGVDTEDSYKYTPVDEKCKFNATNIGATISSYINVTSGSEDALQEAVAVNGPVSVCITVLESFQTYQGGIYDEPLCSSEFSDLDHAIVAVGYGSQDGKDYWIVKNSWAVTWGENGYARMSRNKNNQCGIATLASYPVV